MSEVVDHRSLDHTGAQHERLIEWITSADETARKALPNGWRRTPTAVADILRQHDRWLAQFAFVGARPVGFKLGYAERPSRFYSWLGGVDPDFRRRGIARRLMRDQHRWCGEQGFERVDTATTNAFRPMLLLNLRSGFDIVGTTTRDGRLQILLSKYLTAADGR